MSATNVQQLIEQIRQLSDQDRQMLDERLAQTEDAEWRELKKEGRRIAEERGIDMEAIDRAVERERYGK